MSKFITCGTMKLGVGFSDIVCDVTTGDLIFCDDVNGNCIMSNMSLTNPMPILSEEAVTNILSYTKADGVIMSDMYLIILRDGVAEYRDYADPNKVIHVVEFDTDTVFEGEID